MERGRGWGRDGAEMEESDITSSSPLTLLMSTSPGHNIELTWRQGGDGREFGDGEGRRRRNYEGTREEEGKLEERKYE